MNQDRIGAFMKNVSEEPFARLVGIRLAEAGEGYNLHGMAHGGAVYSLIDEALEISSNSHGTVAVALNVNVTFIKPAKKNSMLRARSQEISRGRKTASYHITVEDNEGPIAVCQALVSRKNEQIPIEPCGVAAHGSK
jgi:acyl-CoA thioesterase